VRGLAYLLAERYADKPVPRMQIGSVDPSRLAEVIMNRFQVSAGMYQMFGWLCDVVILARDGWFLYREMPIRLVTERAQTSLAFFVLTLEYHDEFGRVEGGPRSDTLGARRLSQRLHPTAGHESNFLHPVVRYFARPTGDWASSYLYAPNWKTWSTAVHHVMEDLQFDFSNPELHVQPLVTFLAGLFASRPELAPYFPSTPAKLPRIRSPQAFLDKWYHRSPSSRIVSLFSSTMLAQCTDHLSWAPSTLETLRPHHLTHRTVQCPRCDSRAMLSCV